MSKPKKTPKPYPDFPLYHASNGQWCKKIRGKKYYFGVWSDPDAALQFYNQVKDDLYAGRTPKNADALTLSDLINLFLASKKLDSENGEISVTTYKEYYRACNDCLTILGRELVAKELKAGDFSRLRQELAKKYNSSAVTLKNKITCLRVLFRWAFNSGEVTTPLPYANLKQPTAALLRKATAGQNKLFDQREILAIASYADGYLKPAIWLAINAGFGNRDCCELKWSSIKGDVVEFARPKTGVFRKAVLWPETLRALEAWKIEAPKSEYVCCSQSGMPFSRNYTPMAHAFEIIAEFAGVERDGRGFYCLRHTYRTSADELPDTPAIMLTMGHADQSINGVYRQQISTERLRRVAEHVREWLYSWTLD